MVLFTVAMRYVLLCLWAHILFSLVGMGSTLEEVKETKHKEKIPVRYKERIQAAKYNNPNFIRDRYKTDINKPVMPDAWKDQHKKKYSPFWMDYCDPWHCNDYHKPACGLNRKTMRFRWFQSTCHIIMNNQCAKFRGAMKFTTIEPKWCAVYVRDLRSGCPKVCEDTFKPVCATSYVDNHVVLFKNDCYLEQANCRIATFDEYEEVHMSVCLSAVS